jgi:hypothetical protein
MKLFSYGISITGVAIIMMVNLSVTLASIPFKENIKTISNMEAINTTIISETFANPSSNLSPVDGRWKANKGTYQITKASLTSTTHLNNRSVHVTNISGLFVLTVDAKAARSSGRWDDFAIIFGYQNANNYYFANFNESNNAKTNGIFKVTNGVSVEVRDFTSTISGGTNYKIKIERNGNSILVYCNNIPVGTFIDTAFKDGKVGIGAMNNRATFDNLKVQNLQAEELSVKLYYIYPSDQPFHQEYVDAINNVMIEINEWYRTKAGVNFRLEEVVVMQGFDYLTMRCGTFPTQECMDDRTKHPNWQRAVEQIIDGMPDKKVALIFGQGGGGFAGANLLGNYAGFAYVGDWVLEPISGVREPATAHCGYATWQCEGGVPKGTIVHELGHAFGLHHPVADAGISIMKWHGDYPNTEFLPHEQKILQLNPMFHPNVYINGSPRLDFAGNPDEMTRGASVTIVGEGLAGTTRVEFTDGSSTIFVIPTEVTGTSIRVTIPNSIGMGYMRALGSSSSSNVLPVNFK